MTEVKKVSDLAKLARIAPGQRFTFELEAISKDQKCHAVVAIDYVDMHTKRSISGLFKVRSLNILSEEVSATPMAAAQISSSERASSNSDYEGNIS